MDSTTDYRQVLKSAYSRRREKNASYSLRSYARDLGVSSSMLSEVLSGKKKLSRKTALKINKSLKLSSHDSKLFLLSVDLETPGFSQTRESVESKISEQSSFGKSISLNEERFAFISDFRHLVLLSMIGLPSFKNNLSWIAGKLGVFQHQVTALLNGLKKLKIVESIAGGKIQINHQYIFSSDGSSGKAIREFHRATLQHTAQALDQVPIEERDFYTSIFAIDEADFSEIQKEVREFQQRIYLKFSKKPTANRVYAIQNQIIPYSKRTTE